MLMVRGNADGLHCFGMAFRLGSTCTGSRLVGAEDTDDLRESVCPTRGCASAYSRNFFTAIDNLMSDIHLRL